MAELISSFVVLIKKQKPFSKDSSSFVRSL